MNRQTWNEQEIIHNETDVNPHWLWILTGVALGGLTLLLYYLSGSNFGEEPTPTTSAVIEGQIITNSQLAASEGSIVANTQGLSLPRFEEDSNEKSASTVTEPKFTFYQELVDQRPEYHFDQETPATIEETALRTAQPSTDHLDVEIEQPVAKVSTHDEPSNDSLTDEPNTLVGSTDDSSPSSAEIETDQLTALKPNVISETVPTTIGSNTKKSLPSKEMSSTVKAESKSTKPNSVINIVKDDTEEAALTKKYVLQAGSFKNQLQADRQRAKLLLRGFDANIRKVTLANGDQWHRVLLGPYEKKEATQLRAKLEASAFDTQLKSIK